MKTIRMAQFLWIAAFITALNASASMTYGTTTGATGTHQTTDDQNPSTASNVVFAANNSGSEIISVADTSLAATMSEPNKKPTFVPEPSTIIAGALLLLPFVASVVRAIRKVRTV
jgi:hypothetical protein